MKGISLLTALTLSTCLLAAPARMTVDEEAELRNLLNRLGKDFALARNKASIANQFTAFEEASIHFEVNATDNDGEVVIRAKADTGLADFLMFDPFGNHVGSLKSTDTKNVGIAQFLFESAEPSVASVQAAYPEGSYLFVAITVDGDLRIARTELTHDLLSAPQFSLQDSDISAQSAVIRWLPVDGAVGYAIEVENDDLEFNLTVNVAASVNKFQIPADLLVSGETYDIGVASVSEDGNVAVAESEFSVQ